MGKDAARGTACCSRTSCVRTSCEKCHTSQRGTSEFNATHLWRMYKTGQSAYVLGAPCFYHQIRQRTYKMFSWERPDKTTPCQPSWFSPSPGVGRRHPLLVSQVVLCVRVLILYRPCFLRYGVYRRLHSRGCQCSTSHLLGPFQNEVQKALCEESSRDRMQV